MTVKVEKQLAGMQDFAIGNQKETQSRNGKPVDVNQISISYLFDNVQDAVAGDDSILVIGRYVSTGGYWTPGDGGGANYLVVAGGTGTHDGGSYIDCINGTQLQFTGSSISLYQYGAKGDGSDEGDAIQAAWDSGLPISQVGGIFTFEKTLRVPSNSTHLYTNDCTLTKTFLGSGIVNSNHPSGVNENIDITGLRIRQSNTAARGNVVEMVTVNNLRLHKLNIVQTAVTQVIGAWSLYVSGDDIDITEPYIDSRLGGIYADGIHTAYVRNLTIANGTILAGDDAVAIFPPDKSWGNAGQDKAGGNILVTNMFLASVDANMVRFGAGSTAYEAADALPNVVFDGVTFSNIIEVPVAKSGTGRNITCSDGRSGANINGVHDNIIFSNIEIISSTGGGSIGVMGNWDITQSSNRDEQNFNNLEFNNVRVSNTSNGSTIRAGGVTNLSMLNSKLHKNIVSTHESMRFGCIDSLTLTNCSVKTGEVGSASNGATVVYVKSVSIAGGDTLSGGEFRTWSISSNALQDTNVSVKGYNIKDAQRGVDNLDGTGYASFICTDTSFTNTVVDVTAAARNFATGRIARSDQLVTSGHTTGGASSAGAGNQYVEIEVEGVKYKVLHDGTI